MTDHRCPGQDMRYWKPEDIFQAPCATCGKLIEYWKDEPTSICPGCRQESRNPRISLGCAAHCAHGSECLGEPPLPPQVHDEPSANRENPGEPKS